MIFCNITYRRSNSNPYNSHKYIITTISQEYCNLKMKNEVIRRIAASIESIFRFYGKWLVQSKSFFYGKTICTPKENTPQNFSSLVLAVSEEFRDKQITHRHTNSLTSYCFVIFLKFRHCLHFLQKDGWVVWKWVCLLRGDRMKGVRKIMSNFEFSLYLSQFLSHRFSSNITGFLF